ncbi:MAG: PD40 domain-containing protein [Bacteroidia bacterium]|nr:PD40 domain-containing protein [Bacteroidia bacterium]MBT8275394.1 PD40 domain-containing protein [Bacteroidia bacterium]NNF30900.1 hypothetical protein [Flavobacteriaceae bacterium]NNM08015.1 hypothetical protein [Flavobacteriaceae bacterium]
MKKLLLLLLILCGLPLIASGQVSLKDVVEDKKDMADSYYGIFKYKGKPFTGEATEYYENGQMKSSRNYKDGMYQGYWTEWYSNGNMKFRGDRYKNKGEGLTKWWHENGQLKKMGTYNLDKQHGAVLRWYDNGNLQQIRYYINDIANGNWTTFDKNGDVLDEGNDMNRYYRPFFGNDTAPEGFEETSPSFTADGNTMVFARYTDWVKKVPYIAYKNGKTWKKEKLPIADTLYNLAISAEGNRIVFKKFEYSGEDEISRTFVVDRINGSWGSPKEVDNLFNINAGYFQFTKEGVLYMFARKPRNGIYYSEPTPDGYYSKPKWLSDEVGLEKSDSFDVHIHPEKNKLIITQAYSTEKYPNRGAIGMYYYKKKNGEWVREKRIPLGYAWGACITPDGKFVFVRNGNLQFVNLTELEIDW